MCVPSAMDLAGIGPTHVNNILTTLNIPPLDAKTLQRQERAIGVFVEQVAQKSCAAAAAEEAEKTTNEAGITMSFDCGWQKRGRAMNSLTGVGHGMGLQTDKVVAYATCFKRCATCSAAERLNKAPALHDCRRHHNKSSKAMEAESVADIAQSLKSSDVDIAVLVGDDDSSAIKRLRQKCGEVSKSSDLNHVKKSLGNRLYELKSKGNKELSDMVIKSVQKMFMYAVAQNKGDPIALKAAVDACVPHMYGDHVACGSWCTFASSPETYRHSGLPRGQDLPNTPTKYALAALFASYDAEKLASHGSSQENESLNNTICSKQPKSRSYGSSPSFNIRVGAAVSQKNLTYLLTYTYVSDVMSAAGLSPSRHAMDNGAKMDRKRGRDSLRKSSKPVRRRRLFGLCT